MKTKKMKKVLIALDYNPTAQKVAEEGFSMAKAMKAEVILLHVMLEPYYYYSEQYHPIMGFGGYMDKGSAHVENLSELKKVSLQFLEKTKHHLGDKNIQTKAEKGDLAETIIKTAKKLHANIIVMGSHSKRWMENILMGSVTEKVLHQTSIPLFIIPTKKHN